MKTSKHNLITGCLCAFFCQAFFGMSYIFTKQATQIASPFALMGWRFLTAFVVMSILVVSGFVKVNFKGKNIRQVLSVAVFCPCLYFVGETVGVAKTTASESGVFIACIPVSCLIASSLLLKKKPGRIQVAGILITLVGVIMTVIAVGTSSSFSLFGYACLLLAVVVYALYSVFVEKAVDFSEVEISYFMMLAGSVFFVTVSVFEAFAKGNMLELVTLPIREKSFLIAVIYQALACSIGSFLLYNIAISKVGVNRTSSFVGISTVITILAGAFILHENISKFQIIGAAVIVGGVYIANTEKARKDKSALNPTYIQTK